MTHSRNKGKRGEREWADFLTEHGFEARRGAQHRGGPDSPDVVCPDLPGYHWEVKYQGHLRIYEAMEQAASEAPPEKTPVVAMRLVRRGGKKHPWLVVMRAEDFLRTVRGDE